MNLVQELIFYNEAGFKFWLEAKKLKYLQIGNSANKDDVLHWAKENKDKLVELLQYNNLTHPNYSIPYVYKISNQLNNQLSFAQERLWFIDQYEKGTSAYNILLAFELKKSVNINYLEKSLQQLVARHEILHTLIKQDKLGNAYQQVTDLTSNPFKIIEKTVNDEAGIKEQLKKYTNKIFQLDREYPINATIYLNNLDKRYYLAIVIHHIAFDGWSESIFIRDLISYYNYYLQQGLDKSYSLELPAIDIQYKDFSVWQRLYMTGHRQTQQLNYWKELLSDYSPLNLITDKVRPASYDYKGAEIEFVLEKGLSDNLREVAKICNVSLYSVLLSAYYLLLRVYSDQDDIVIGTPVANRHYQQIENTIGFFINSLALRVQINPQKSLIEFIKEISGIVIRAQDNQDLPFEKLVESLKVPKDPSRHPVFQILFNVNTFIKAAKSTSIELDIMKPYKNYGKTCVSKFDLSVTINDNGDDLSGWFIYATSLYEKETVSRFFQTYHYILSQFSKISQNKNIKISDISYVNDKQYYQLVQEWNRTDTNFHASHKLLHRIFEEQVLKTPDAISVTYDNESFSYQELNQKSNQLARVLQHTYKSITNQVLTPDCLIVVSIERSVEMIITLLAILKAGAAYVPIDPNFPEERILYILNDTNAQLLLTQKNLLYKMEKVSSIEKIIIDEVEYKNEESTNLVVYTQPHNLAYVLYTSGTTGNPKGVMIKHSGIVNRILWMQQEYNLNDNDSVLQKTPYVFDVSVWELFWPICYGAKLVFARPGGHKDYNYLLTLIKNNKISIIHFVPSMLEACVQYMTDVNIKFSDSLRYIFCSGESLPEHLLAKIALIINKNSLKIYNLYGPTETSVDSTYFHCDTAAKIAKVYIGKPIANTKIYIVNKQRQLVPIGAVGELCIAGAGLARGYLNKQELTNEKFIENPFVTEFDIANGYIKMYKTGDLARWNSSGNIEYIGRNDSQVKIRGFRIELDEIQHALASLAEVQQAVVLEKIRDGQKYLAAYLTCEQNKFDATRIKDKLLRVLPEYMVPSTFTKLAEFPLTINGKLDKSKLPEPDFRLETNAVVEADDELQAKILLAWKEILKQDQIGIYDQFFNVGGNSLLTLQLRSKLNALFNVEFDIANIFQYPTVATFAEFIQEKIKNRDNESIKKFATKKKFKKLKSSDIAIIGMACRAPGADNIREYWSNLVQGVESVTDLSDEELLLSGIDKDLLDNPNYVKRGGFINHLEQFDAKFFGYSPREAQSIDPQIRHFLECAWMALEDSGNLLQRSKLRIGVFSGKGTPHYLIKNVMNHRPTIDALGAWQVIVNNKYLSSKVSYHFNLTGPSLDVDTACSTGLVSVHLAIDSLLSNQCDIALAGGVSLSQKTGFLFQEGMIISSDGHCRAFDEKANGTIGGSAVGVVVLKPLSKALEDKDQIYAVIKGSAINNDGLNKVGYTAPSITGQADVIQSALEKSGVDPETISYVEAHGTATALGDPIEISALTQVYRKYTDKKSYVALGSVKTNIGHTDVAAGAMGLIKAALALKNKKIPKSLHFNKANPEIDFGNSPFYVNTELKEWKNQNGSPLRAAVSSFGIGGTNAHVILEETFERHASSSSRKYQLILSSAKSSNSLIAYISEIKRYLVENPLDNALADAAYTLKIARERFPFRQFFIASTNEQSCLEVDDKIINKYSTKVSDSRNLPEIVFMFSGQGSQYIDMARQLFEQEKFFRQTIINCCNILNKLAGIDLLPILYPGNADNIATAREKLTQTNYAQPALFIVEYALASLLMHWGIKPVKMIGHSIGEYTAATLAGVFCLEDAIGLVAARGRLMNKMQPGSMLSVNMPINQLKQILPKELSIAAFNSPTLTVVSGETQTVEAFSNYLEMQNISCSKLHTSHAFHSPMMQEAARQYAKLLLKVNKRNPKINFISNVTGDFITNDQATSNHYWVEQLLTTVQYQLGMTRLLENKNTCFIEVGPGNTLATFAIQNGAKLAQCSVLSSIRHFKEKIDERVQILTLLGHLWCLGVEINWQNYYKDEQRNKVALPAYHFDHKTYWIEPTNKIIVETESKLVAFTNKQVEAETVEQPVPIQANDFIKEKLLFIWKKLLDAHEIYEDDNFIDLGGHSLLAVQLLHNLHTTFNLNLKVKFIFDFPTIRTMASQIEQLLELKKIVTTDSDTSWSLTID
jgi:amino acid adenylation domain-containing protein